MAADFEKIFSTVAPIAKDILISYFAKGKVDNATWLTKILSSNKSTAADAVALAAEISSTIGRFSQNMRDVEKNCAAGKTKEQWLRSFIEKNVNLPPQEKGEYLAQVNAALNLGSQTLADKNQTDLTQKVNQLEKQELPPTDPKAQWNKYTMTPNINKISKQAELMGANSSSADMPKVPSEDILKKDALESERGSVLDEGLKMVATAALKIAHDAGKLPFLPKALPVGVITNVACVGVEAFKSIYQVSTGKMTRLQAAENVGRAAVVAIADLCASGLPAKLLLPIPVVGPALSFGVSTLLMASSSETIQQKIYAGIEALTPVAKQIAANILKSNEVTATTNTVSNTVRAGVNF